MASERSWASAGTSVGRSGPGEAAPEAPAVDDVGGVRARHHGSRLAPAVAPPVLQGDPPPRGRRGNGDRGVVLLGAVDAVREVVVHGDVVELRRGMVELTGPVLPAVEGDVHPELGSGVEKMRPNRIFPD